MIFNERLRAVRQSKGLTQAALAQKINMPESSYQRFEYQSLPAYKNLFALAEALDVSVDYLMGRTDNREVNRV